MCVENLQRSSPVGSSGSSLGTHTNGALQVRRWFCRNVSVSMSVSASVVFSRDEATPIDGVSVGVPRVTSGELACEYFVDRVTC